MATYNIKTNRAFTLIRKYGFIFTLTVAIGGLWFPKLGLLVIPVMIGLLLYSFFKGRYWCGNICAHGSLFDSVLLKFSLNKKIPKFFRSKILSAVFLALFSYKLITKFISVAGIYGSSSFFDKIGMIFVYSYLMVTILGGFLALIISPRTWCNFCPMGVMQKLSYKLGKLLKVTKITDEKITITNTDMCHKCGKCARVCPMQLTPYKEFNESNQFDHKDCIKCSTCVENCPAGILTLANEKVAKVLEEKVSCKGYENREKIKSQITDIRELNDEVTEYTFKFLEPNKVNYEAGQFIIVKVLNDPEMYRAYSISSYDTDGQELSVTIKKVEDGYGTDIIFNTFKVGDEVELEGPMGDELIVDKNSEKVLLVATGIGITPFLPIVTDLIKGDNNVKEIKLLYGVRYEKDLLFVDEFNELEKSSDKFQLIQFTSRDENWKGRRGHVTKYLKEMDLLHDYKIYMCGTKTMIDSTLDVLMEKNVDKHNVSCESA